MILHQTTQDATLLPSHLEPMERKAKNKKGKLAFPSLLLSQDSNLEPIG